MITKTTGKNGSTFTLNIKTRIFGILFLQENRDVLRRILDKYTTHRLLMEDPSQRMKSLYDQISDQVNDHTIQISHPDGWDNMIRKKKGRKWYCS